MNSKIMESIGLGNLDIFYVILFMLILIIALAVLSFIQLSNYKKLKRRYDKFMQGERARSLETQIAEIIENQRYLDKLSESNLKKINDLYKRQQTDFQKVSLVKYDAFKEMGGKLSFCLALLDEGNNGFILNSVHSSNGCYLYTKRIKNGGSDIALGEEEKVALERAIESGTKSRHKPTKNNEEES